MAVIRMLQHHPAPGRRLLRDMDWFLAVRQSIRSRLGSKRGGGRNTRGTMTENGNQDCSTGLKEEAYIDDADRALTPYGRFVRHGYMHAGTVPMVFDEFGRCAYCVKNGFWRPNG
jgi:hypothetical protein